jgi:hypothetical protein
VTTVHPTLDQLAAHVREQSADKPESVEKLAAMYIDTMRPYLAHIPDEHIGAVLLVAASMAIDPGSPLRTVASVSNLMGLVGEKLHHGDAS